MDELLEQLNEERAGKAAEDFDALGFAKGLKGKYGFRFHRPAERKTHGIQAATPLRIIAALSSGPMYVRELHEETGLSPSTVNKWLPRLEHEELVLFERKTIHKGARKYANLTGRGSEVAEHADEVNRALSQLDLLERNGKPGGAT